MANAEHLAILRQGVDAWNVWREKGYRVQPDLFRPDHVRPDDFRPDLSAADLREADLRGANLHGANLSEAILREANLSRADLSEAILHKAILHKAILDRANLGRANLGEADLSGAILDRAVLNQADLSRANLSWANLNRADLSRAILRKANLSWANLNRADLSGVDRSEWNRSKRDIDWYFNNRTTDLSEADLRGAILHGANLSNAVLSGADLSEANLSEANLGGANFNRTNLIDAHLDGANLMGTKLWETQRGGWSIKNVICPIAFWDRDGKEPIKYEEGEFERIFAEKPRIILRYAGGISPIDLLALPLVVERLQAQYPGSVLQIHSMQNDAGGASVTITVEDRENRGTEALNQELVRIQTKLEQAFEERDYLRQLVKDALTKIAESPRQEIHYHRPRGRIEGPTMSRDTYNIPGQAGAVGPGAHAEKNAFQQNQALAMRGDKNSQSHQ